VSEFSVPPRARRNVLLTGFMGTGKTSVGAELAERLGYEFVDTDAVIVERHGPITEIFATRGEAEFRRIEGEVASELSQRSGLVISTGGRMLVDPDNATALSATGRVICLTASVATVLARVAPDGVVRGRPMLEGHPDLAARITDLLAERAPAYARFEQVATDGLTVSQVCDVILDRLAM
jgi:shikimate kinase